MSARLASVSGRTSKWIFALMLAGIGVIFYLLCVHTPLMMDDYDYSFSWTTGERLAGLGDIVASQAAHYMLWGGRSVTHFLAQLFLLLGKPVFNAANTGAYLLLLLEMYFLARRRESAWDWRMLLVAHLLLNAEVAFFGVAFLWLDGACNYLWGTALALLPLLIMKSEREQGAWDSDRPWCLLAVPLCFVCGWTNENTACGVLAAMILLLGWDMIKKRRIRPWRVVAVIAHALGVAVMLLAPGNFARAAEETSRGFVMEMIYRAAVTAYCFVRYAGVPALLAAFALAAAIKRKVSLRIEWLCVLAGCALLSAGALIGSPQISDRSFTAVIVLAICTLMALVGDIKPQADTRSVRLGAALMIAGVLVGVQALGAVRTHEAAWHEQLARIEQAAAAGEERVNVRSVLSSSRFTMDIALDSEPSAWPNSTLGKYYGVGIVGE